MSYLVPAGIVAHFLLEKDRIARDLCVQRMVPEAMRTCHGQCYVMRQLQQAEQHERDLPGDLRALRLDEAMVDRRHALHMPLMPPVELFRRTDRPATSDGYPGCTDPVPWC